MTQFQLSNIIRLLPLINSVDGPGQRGLQKAMFGALLTWHEHALLNYIPLKPHEFVPAPKIDPHATRSFHSISAISPQTQSKTLYKRNFLKENQSMRNTPMRHTTLGPLSPAKKFM
jgi:hypothetical protein